MQFACIAQKLMHYSGLGIAKDDGNAFDKHVLESIMNDTSDANCDSKEIQFILNRIDTFIKTQYELISQRMTWLVMSQSFLFIAYANLMNKSNGHNFPLTFYALPKIPDEIPCLLTWIIPVIGILMASLVIISIRAAHHVIVRLKTMRIAYEEKHQSDCMVLSNKDYKPISVSLLDWEHCDGNMPAICLPYILLLAWCLVLGLLGIILGVPFVVAILVIRHLVILDRKKNARRILCAKQGNLTST